MHWKPTTLALALAATLVACATTTSPTGRTQYLAYSDSQLDQMGAQGRSHAPVRVLSCAGDSPTLTFRNFSCSVSVPALVPATAPKRGGPQEVIQ